MFLCLSASFAATERLVFQSGPAGDWQVVLSRPVSQQQAHMVAATASPPVNLSSVRPRLSDDMEKGFVCVCTCLI